MTNTSQILGVANIPECEGMDFFETAKSYIILIHVGGQNLDQVLMELETVPAGTQHDYCAGMDRDMTNRFVEYILTESRKKDEQITALTEHKRLKRAWGIPCPSAQRRRSKN